MPGHSGAARQDAAEFLFARRGQATKLAGVQRMSNAPYFRAQANMCDELASLSTDLKMVTTLTAEAGRFRAEAEAIEKAERSSEAKHLNSVAELSRRGLP